MHQVCSLKRIQPSSVHSCIASSPKGASGLRVSLRPEGWLRSEESSPRIRRA